MFSTFRVEDIKPCIWPGRIICQVTQDWFIGNTNFNQAVDEMLENPDIFIVDYNDLCDHKCITCDQRRNLNLGELNQSLDDSNLITLKDTNAVPKKEKIFPVLSL